MATSCNCCIFNNLATIDLTDPCVCNAPIGATLVTNTGAVYVRTLSTTPCNVNDWQISGSTTFNITDAFANIQNITNGDTVTFLGSNGIDVKVSATDTVSINGLTTFGAGAPVGNPLISNQVNLYLDTNNGNFYIWSPVGPTWVGPITNGSSATLSAICGIVEGTYLNTVPIKVFQDQAGNCEVVQHNHQPFSNPQIRFNGGLILGLDGGDSSTGQNGDNLTYLWFTFGGTFDDDTSPSPVVTFTTPGEYFILLTVTNALGNSHTSTLRVSVDRILNVMGNNINHNLGFGSLQTAFDWITNNDGGNEALWLINVHDTTSDAFRITPNEAAVHFTELGKITVGVDFPANKSFLWSGDSHSDSHFNIDYSNDFQIHVGNGAAVEFNNLTISITFNSYIIDTLGNGSITFKDCLLIGERGILMIAGALSLLTIQNTEIRTQDVILELTTTELQINGLIADSSSNVITNGVKLDRCYGFITHSKFTSVKSAAMNSILLDIIPHPSNELIITHNLFRIIGVVAGTFIACFIHGAGNFIELYHNEFIGHHYGMALLNNVSVGFIFAANNFFQGNTNSLITSSTYPAVTSVALANLNFVNNSFKLPVSGATFVAAVNLTNGNFQF